MDSGDEREEQKSDFELAVERVANDATSAYLVEWLWIQYSYARDDLVYAKDDVELKRGRAQALADMFNTVSAALPKHFNLQLMLKRDSVGAKLAANNKEATTR
ncbi:MAG: hypothetical protein IJI37_00850 [Opitutales bacterium]|nr:hypothetical protein [Opitutales bacterium]